MSLDKITHKALSSTELKDGHSDSATEQTPILGEQTWKDIEESVTRSLTQMFQEVHGRSGLYAEDEHADALDRLKVNEKIFFTKVLGTVERAHRSYENTAVLFDVDETIGRAPYRADGKRITILRPSVIPLMDILKNTYGCKLGLFTSRGKLQEQLEDPAHLATLEPYLDKELLISTRGSGSSIGSMEFSDALQVNFGGENGIVDDSLISPDPFQRPSLIGDIEKLSHLRKIRAQLPEGAIVIVDDMQYPAILNESRGLYGVSLDFSEQNTGTFRL